MSRPEVSATISATLSVGVRCAVILPVSSEQQEEAATAFLAEPGATVSLMHGYETIGEAWSAGVDRLVDDHGPIVSGRDPFPRYVLLARVELVPRPGWLAAAVEAVEEGFTPSPALHRDYEPEPADWRRATLAEVCFFRTDEWMMFGPIPALNEYAGQWFSTASLHCARRPIVIRNGFAFDDAREVGDWKAGAERKQWLEFRRRCRSDYGPAATIPL